MKSVGRVRARKGTTVMTRNTQEKNALAPWLGEGGKAVHAGKFARAKRRCAQLHDVAYAEIDDLVDWLRTGQPLPAGVRKSEARAMLQKSAPAGEFSADEIEELVTILRDGSDLLFTQARRKVEKVANTRPSFTPEQYEALAAILLEAAQR